MSELKGQIIYAEIQKITKNLRLTNLVMIVEYKEGQQDCTAVIQTASGQPSNYFTEVKESLELELNLAKAKTFN